MERYVAYENIRRFRLLLEHELDPKERRMVERLLAAEEAKLGPREPQPDLRTGEDPA